MSPVEGARAAAIASSGGAASGASSAAAAFAGVEAEAGADCALVWPSGGFPPFLPQAPGPTTVRASTNDSLTTLFVTGWIGQLSAWARPCKNGVSGPEGLSGGYLLTSGENRSPLIN